jgi:predicted nucleic acid-binding protein
MTAKLLVDTNLLVYAYDKSEHTKRLQATAILDRLVEENAGSISTQVLVEFANAVTRKIRTPLSASEAYAQVEDLLRVWRVFNVTPQIVLEALRGVRDYGFSIWDAQIWATARANEISVILTEDFNSGATIEGVRFVNPFVHDFDIALLLTQDN